MVNTSFKMTRIVLVMLAVWSVVILVWTVHLIIVKAAAKPPILSDKRLFKRHEDGQNQPLNIVKYEELTFYTVFNDFPAKTGTDLLKNIKILIGGFHELKEHEGSVPTILIYLNSTTKMLNEQDMEAIGAWNKVQIFDGKIVQMDEVERHVKSLANHKNAVWISPKYAFDPVALDLRRADLVSEGKMFTVAYEKGREIIIQIYETGSDIKVGNDIILRRLERRRKSDTEESSRTFQDSEDDLTDSSKINSSHPRHTTNNEHNDTLSVLTTYNAKYPSIDKNVVFPLVTIKSLATTRDLHCYVDLNWKVLKGGGRLLDVNDFKKLEKIGRAVEGEGKGYGAIAIGVPTTSKGLGLFSIKNKNKKKHVLLSTLLPSLVKTTKNYSSKIVLFIGFDRGDEYFENKIWRDELSGEIKNLLKGSPQIDFVFMSLIPVKRVAQTWNQIFAFAREIVRFEYYYQVNDDLTMETEGWADKFIGALKSVGDIGVCGPSDSFNEFSCSLLTQAFVSAKHFEIFSGRFYPIEISDWKSDRWLSFVYPQDRTFCWPDVKARNGGTGTRYVACPFPGWKVYLNRDKKVVLKFITKSFELDKHTARDL